MFSPSASQTEETGGWTFEGGISPVLESYAISGPAGEILLSTAHGALVRVLQTQFKSFGLIGFSTDGEIIFAGGGSGGIALFNVQSGNSIAQLYAHREEVLSAALQGEQLLSGDYRGTVYLRPLYLDPFQSITEAGKVLRILSEGVSDD